MTIRNGVEYANMIQAERVVVICPAADCFDWLRQIKEATTMRDPFGYVIQSSRYGVSESANWTVSSPEIIRKPRILRPLSKQRFDLLLTLSSLMHRIPEELIAVCGGTMICDRISDEKVTP